MKYQVSFSLGKITTKKTLKQYSRLSSAAVVMSALRVKGRLVEDKGANT